MFLRWFVLSMLFAAAAVAAPQSADDGLPNAGFEDAAPGGTAAAEWGSGAALSDDAHSGKRSARLRSEGPQTAIFQRLFQGLRSGRLTFWYKAVAGVSEAQPKPETNLSLHVIPANAKEKEYPPFRRCRYDIPAEHIGDGKWHQGAIRFNFLDDPAVTAVYIGPRVNELSTQTMPVGAGEVLFDDFAWEALGPKPRLGPLRLEETPGREGVDATLACDLTNEGDQAALGLAASVLLPPKSGLRVTASPGRTAVLEPLARVELKWTLAGRRAAPGLPLAVEIRSGSAPAIRGKLLCRPVLEVQALTVPRTVLWRGERMNVEAVLANTGTATAEGVRVSLRLPAGVKCVGGALDASAGSLAPGATRLLRWSVLAEAPGGPGPVVVQATAAKLTPVSARRDLIVSLRARDPGGRGSRRAGPVGERQANDLVLQNPHLRLLLPGNPAGYGVAEVQIRQGSAWRSLAVLPYLARVRFRGAAGRIEEHAFAASDAVTSRQGSSAALKLTGRWRDAGGAAWRCVAEYSLAPAATSAAATLTVSVNQARDILLCEGPVLLAGEGSTGAAKDLALFPGLDFLGPDEPSNQVWNPGTARADERVAPDPLKITIPFMGVSGKGAAVGLLWNARDRWDGTHDRVSARFVSPDWEELRAHHRMALFVPTVPAWVPENGAQAAKPYRLLPGKSLRFRCRIAARPGTVLDLQRDWLDAYGVPAVPANRWSYEEFARLAVDAENNLRYEAERFAWRHSNTIPAGQGQFNPQLCADMWLESIRTADPARRESLRRHVLEAAKPHASRIEVCLPFHIGLLEPALDGVRKWSLALMEKQLPDGGWGLQKRAGLPEWIGKDGTVASGTCAAEALRLMRYARITGAPDVYAAARRGLAALEKDPIPRGGQTWEVPVQVADIIVAGYASEAYLDAYRISGDPKDLERAVYWAKTGVHFYYLWGLPSQPVMVGCSIPVYGNNWFARPVQWCGREMLEPMLDLAGLDDSLPWRRISECAAVASMQQCIGPDRRMYPDTEKTPADKLHWKYPYEGWRDFDKWPMDVIDNFWLNNPRRFPCWFMMISSTRATPLRQGFVDSLWRLMGADPRPDTVVVRAGESRIHLSAAGKVSDAAVSAEGSVSFRVRYAPKETAYAVVAGLGLPARVLSDERELPQVPDLDAAPEGWRRHRGMLFLKLPNAGDVRVSIEGAKAERPLDAAKAE